MAPVPRPGIVLSVSDAAEDVIGSKRRGCDESEPEA